MKLLAETLSIGFRRRGIVNWVVRDVTLDVGPGQIVAIVGESGSGKSVLARTLVGLTGRHAVVEAQALRLDDRDLLNLTERDWLGVRGRQIGFIPQDVLVSLDPLRRLGDEVAEPLVSHRWGTSAERRSRVLEALQDAGIDEPERRARQRSGLLSGGLRQRGLIASATAMEPDLLIADEPTTALDPIVQLKLFGLFRRLKREGKGILIISHDLDFVSRVADEIIVMNKGEIVERGDMRAVMDAPQQEYTRKLITSVPSRIQRTSSARKTDASRIPVFEAIKVSKAFGSGDARHFAVRDVGFSVHAGQSLGIIGGSGSGKTTLTRLLMGLTTPTSGSIAFDGQVWNDAVTPVPERVRRKRRHRIGMIYQDPLGSFDPRWDVRKILDDAGKGLARTDPSRRTVEDLLALVRLDRGLADRHPLKLSGGQRQRVAIARAIAGNPSVLICDEPVSALDLSVQSEILRLLARLQEELGLSLVIISHDMAVIRAMCDHVLVMRDGCVIEQGETEDLFAHPREAFSRALISTIAPASLDQAVDAVPLLVENN